jgi:CRISPR-associated exonuclease Cas4
MIVNALIAACLVSAAAAAWLYWRARIPGRVIESDGPLARPARVLRSARYGVGGKPDLLIVEKGLIAPMELKPTRESDEPWLRDVVQLAAYCLLVEETYEHPAGYGYLGYANRTFRIDFTDTMRATLLNTLRDLRADMDATRVSRDHTDRRRCARCPLRPRCGESLA